ncbi:hypothetical protein [Streptomyces lavendulocolor]|uniref:hypothetical protein n=1 Tax=Streptomyces lavendulocolor TaxID=67316 RepID=UPI0034018ABC
MNSLLTLTKGGAFPLGGGAVGQEAGRAPHCAVAQAVIGDELVAVPGADLCEPDRFQPGPQRIEPARPDA